MRIMLFAAGGDIGGGKTHILSLASELSRINDLRLVSFWRGVLAKEAGEMGIDTVTVDESLGISHAVKTALAQYDEFRPDIVHCHGAKANLIGAIVKARRGACVITTVHSDPKLDYMATPFKALTNGQINQLALRRMDHQVAVAGRMHDLLIERGFDPYNIFTIYNGLDFSEAPKEPRPSKAPGDPIVVGIAARLNPVKDIETLIKAFAKAYEKDKRLRLSIAGTGEDGEKLKALAAAQGISEVTRFEGWVSDIRSYFRGVDINVLSSLSETFPYSLLEGAYEHCPAIASNVGGIPYLIEHGITGYLFEPGDVEAFSELILKLAADEALRSRLAEKLFERAKNDFSLQRMAADQQKIYETILARKTRPARSGAVLCGAYGRGNSGDEAILKAIALQLRAVDPDIPLWVMTRNPVATSKNENVRGIYIFNVFRFLKALGKAQLFVNGGGSLIQDVTSARSLYFYLFTLLAAKKRGCRIVMYGCGIGPLKRQRSRRAASRVLNKTADIITLRDGVSLDLLREIGVERPEMKLAADPGFSLPKVSEERVEAAFEQEGIPVDIPKACFCIRSWPGFRGEGEVAKAAAYTYEKYGLVPVFFPIEIPADISISEASAGLLSCPHYICRHVHPAEVQIGMLGSMDVVVGMRLHSLIFATAGGSSVVGISYDVKVDSFISDIGSDLCLKMDSLNAEDLERCIDDAVSRGRSAGVLVRDRLTERERQNGFAVRKLLGEKS